MTTASSGNKRTQEDFHHDVDRIILDDAGSVGSLGHISSSVTSHDPTKPERRQMQLLRGWLPDSFIEEVTYRPGKELFYLRQPFPS